jgi:hypothetical protein
MKRYLAPLILLCLLVTGSEGQVAQSKQQQAQQSKTNQNTSQPPHYYTNSDGQRVKSPMRSPFAPAGATARCRDGSWSFSQHRQGTCSHHGGVGNWLVH